MQMGMALTKKNPITKADAKSTNQEVAKVRPISPGKVPPKAINITRPVKHMG
jgi:hypothetical protein